MMRHLRRVGRKLQTVWGLPLVDQLQIPLVWVMLGLARATILRLPFRWYARLLGRSVGVQVFTPLLTEEQTARARRIRRLVENTAKYTPWESKCLVQAMVAALLLQRAAIPYILHFGLAKHHAPQADTLMNAHAWVTAGAVAVTGGRSLQRFVVVGGTIPFDFSLKS
jgi:hypothetical protein